MKTKLIILLFFFGQVCISQDFWEIINTPDSIKIRTITFDNDNNILLGTGANNSHAGIYRSSNSGDSWELLYYRNNIDTACNIISLHVDVSGHIYAGTGGGYHMIKSTNNGNSWDSLFHFTSDVGIVSKIITLGTDTVYLSSGFSSGTNTSKILRSIDNGNSWDTIYKTGSFYISDFEVLKNGNIYLSQGRFSPSGGNILKSTNGGESWEYIGLEGHQIQTIEFNNSGDLFAAEWCGNVYVLYQGDEEFTIFENWICAEDIKINSDEHIFLGCGEGMLRSIDNGQSFHKINGGLNWYFLHVGEMEFDKNEFLYANEYLTNRLAKSIDSTTVFLEENQLSCFNLIPNPYQTHFSICILNQIAGDLMVEMFDLSGRQVHSVHNDCSSKLSFQIIPPADLPTGMYIVKVKTTNGVWIKKVLKN